ncbi:hypothetical protein CLV91_1162 [Maribacter vaceletii]|uniref:Uncharacterized protein n=2 Tax=Maribacter vaceletii TaxID=1206816 RepID=A0A495EDT0_9FLAO|nr:hypothetical protein CLV91_1162 [Maribacter vaceletii]
MTSIILGIITILVWLFASTELHSVENNKKNIKKVVVENNKDIQRVLFRNTNHEL